MQKLLEQRETMLAEMSHRVANSLQIIASILLMKAKTVESPETRLHLDDARRRVLSVAAVQEQLQGACRGEKIAVGPYLFRLCETLAKSMVAEERRMSVKVAAAHSCVSSHDAVSIGLIVTELVINAIKHAFPESKLLGHIIVGYEIDGSDWKLSVGDDGVGMPDLKPSTRRAGLGTTLMKALAQQLEAQVEIKSGSNGRCIGNAHNLRFPRASSAASASGHCVRPSKWLSLNGDFNFKVTTIYNRSGGKSGAAPSSNSVKETALFMRRPQFSSGLLNLIVISAGSFSAALRISSTASEAPSASVLIVMPHPARA